MNRARNQEPGTRIIDSDVVGNIPHKKKYTCPQINILKAQILILKMA
jgi:hypothetical protein